MDMIRLRSRLCPAPRISLAELPAASGPGLVGVGERLRVHACNG